MREIVLPKLGESILSATVVQWLKRVGDPVALDEPLLEVATDKVNSEIPSPFAGVLQALCVKEGEEVAVGAPLALIATEGSQELSSKPSQEPQREAPALVQTCCAAKRVATGAESRSERYSPAVLRLAHCEGIDMQTLSTIVGSGEGGRITKKDIETWLSVRTTSSSALSPVLKVPVLKVPVLKVPALEVPAHSAPLNANLPQEAPHFSAEEERVEMSSMRRAIADNMVRSFYEAPHASVVTEVDVTEIMQLITKEKARFQAAHGVKLTVTSFIVHALAKALGEYPLLNASLEEQTIVMKRSVHVGVAVNVAKGLLVPVIKNCQERGLVSIASALSDISARARSSKLAPDDVRGGTITLTNFGMSGALIGVPIIHHPEVAIIGVGGIQKRVVVREDDSFAIRHMVYITLTFDHRVIDGIYGCDFLAAFKRRLESFAEIS